MQRVAEDGQGLGAPGQPARRGIVADEPSDQSGEGTPLQDAIAVKEGDGGSDEEHQIAAEIGAGFEMREGGMIVDGSEYVFGI